MMSEEVNANGKLKVLLCKKSLLGKFYLKQTQNACSCGHFKLGILKHQFLAVMSQLVFA